MTISMDKIEDIVKIHMEEQPYRVSCSECGKDLDICKTIDIDFDLEITVTPCDCVTPDSV